MYPRPIIQEIPILKWFRGVKCEDSLKQSAIGRCSICGHHINLQNDGTWYCPVCDQEVKTKE